MLCEPDQPVRSPSHKRVLVGVLNHPDDLRIARERHWYRIPVESARKWIGDRWPPMVLAFYQTKVFEEEAYAVKYYAEVIEVREASWRADRTNRTNR